MIISAALDLGTTNIKAATLDESGLLENIVSVPAPELYGEELVRESSAEDYFKAVDDLLSELSVNVPLNTPIGLASQRSSFLLWEKESGKPVTPLISWQDRRAEDWCDRHDEETRADLLKTGLPLTPHYPGPKLASMLEQDSRLKNRLGEMMFGQIDSYCIWRWCSEYQVDISMAARTLFADIKKGAWSEELLRVFGVETINLPEIVPTWNRSTPLGRTVLRASVSDQAASLIALGGHKKDVIMVNLGTGGFVMSSTGQELRQQPGYLSGPTVQGSDGSTSYALEGTINGIAGAIDSWEAEEVEFVESDPAPNTFCIPDTTGIGAPFWLGDLSQPWCGDPESLGKEEQMRVIMEGIIFRICQIISETVADVAESGIYLSGGLSTIPFLRSGVASCLGRDLKLSGTKESTLLGAARLAAGDIELPAPEFETVRPQPGAEYLKDKYQRWSKWAASFRE